MSSTPKSALARFHVGQIVDDTVVPCLGKGRFLAICCMAGGHFWIHSRSAIDASGIERPAVAVIAGEIAAFPALTTSNGRPDTPVKGYRLAGVTLCGFANGPGPMNSEPSSALFQA